LRTTYLAACRGVVDYKKIKAGFIEEEEDRYLFYYLPEYLADPHAKAVSLTLPLREEPFNAQSYTSRLLAQPSERKKKHKACTKCCLAVLYCFTFQ
jgi:HipA-like protein